MDKEIKESEFYKQVSEYTEEEKQEEASQGDCVFEREDFVSMEVRFSTYLCSNVC